MKIWAKIKSWITKPYMKPLKLTKEVKSKGIVGGSETIDKKSFLQSNEVKLATESITGNLKFITGQTFAPEGKDT